MKKIISLALIGLFLTSFSISAKDWSKIRVATEGAYPPFNFVDKSGKLQGFEIDILKALCKEIKAECSVIAQEWGGVIPGLLARKYDIIVGSMSITEDRKKKVLFSDKYFDTPTRFVAKKGIYGADFDPANKKLGVQHSTIFQEFLAANFPSTKTKLYGTTEEALLDLQSGRLDAVMADGLFLLDGFLNTEGGKDYEFVGKVYLDPKWFGKGIGAAVRKQDKELAEKFNLGIRLIREKGIYQKISKKWFGVDIYDLVNNP